MEEEPTLYFARIETNGVMTEEAKITLVNYFRFVDKLSHDDAMRKVDAIERYLEQNS